MGNRLLSGAACVLLAACAAACNRAATVNSTPAMPQGLPAASKELTDQFDARIRAEWDAIARKDKQALDEMLDENYVAVEADREGERFRGKVLNELDRSSVTQATLSSLKVTALGPDSVFVRYEVLMAFPPGSTQRFLKVLVGEIWVQRNGQWKALHYQETPVK
ncbi:MAG TPA: nuclear transport factor 2 family protein [Candidatus Binatia bacterium]|nr:nuclear transport factor 2 family protein [Candidatus Binatia bacterium]